MIAIFWLSSRTSEESSEQSDMLLELLTKIFGDGLFTTFIVRKSAHCLEYTGLCYLFNIAYCQTLKKRALILSVLSTSLYAVTDEVHQLFVDGRSCELRDWAIDTIGAVFGAAIFLILTSIICAVGKKKKNIIDTANNQSII